MVVENLAKRDTSPPKEGEQTFPTSWTLALVTDNGVVGLDSDDYRLNLVFPKQIAPVLDSIPQADIMRFGTELYLQSLSPDNYRGRRHLDYYEARGQFERYSDAECRALLTSLGIAFEDSAYTQVSDEVIMSALGVEKAKPVKHVMSIAVDDWEYKGELKDSDKPLVMNKAGQVVAYQDRGEAQWAKFYGPMEKNGGRVWVDFGGHEQILYLPFINEQGSLTRTDNGYTHANTVNTFPHSHYNMYAPEGPNATQKAIRKYRDGFINLASEVALMVGKVHSINVTPHKWSKYTPKILHQEGYENIKEIENGGYRWASYKDRDDNVVTAEKDGRRIGIIDVGREINRPSWDATISRPVTDIATPSHLATMIREEIAAAA